MARASVTSGSHAAVAYALHCRLFGQAQDAVSRSARNRVGDLERGNRGPARYIVSNPALLRRRQPRTDLLSAVAPGFSCDLQQSNFFTLGQIAVVIADPKPSPPKASALSPEPVSAMPNTPSNATSPQPLKGPP
jgi:hypothetical protein